MPDPYETWATPSGGSLQGMPGAGNPLISQLLFAVQSMLSNQFNMIPMGLGGGSIPARMAQYQMEQQQYLALKSPDVVNPSIAELRRVAAGGGRIFGATAEQTRSVLDFGEQALRDMPSLWMMMPSAVTDQTKYGLMKNLYEARRYRADPTTRAGMMSPENTNQLGEAIYKRFYGDDNWRDQGTLPPGEMGELATTLSRRGMMGTGRGQKPDSDAVTRTLKDYQSYVQAAREIFGDEGRKGSIEELFEALQSLTGGANRKLGPAAAVSTARNVMSLASNLNIGLEGVAAATQRAMTTGAGMGLDPVFAIRAVGAGLEGGYAYGRQGIGNVVGFGMPTSPEHMKETEDRALRAAASPFAKQMGVLRQLEEAGAGGHGALRPGSRAWQMFEAGEGRGQLQPWMSTMNTALFTQMAAEGSTVVRNQGVIGRMLLSPLNQEYIAQGNYMQLAQEAQGQSGLARSAAQFGFSAFSSLVGPGRKGDAQWLSQAAVEEFAKLSPEILANSRLAAERVSEKLTQRAGRRGRGVSPGQMRGAVIDWRQLVDARIRQSGQYKSFQSYFLHLDPGMARRRLEGRAMGKEQTAFREVTEGMLQHTFTGRIMGALRHADGSDKESLAHAIGEALGGTSKDDLRGRAIMAQFPRLTEFTRQRKEALFDIEAQKNNPAKVAEARKRLEAAEIGLGAITGEMTKLFGADWRTSWTPETLRKLNENIPAGKPRITVEDLAPYLFDKGPLPGGTRGGAGGPAAVAPGSSEPTRITGTLTLRGLDKVVVEGRSLRSADGVA